MYKWTECSPKIRVGWFNRFSGKSFSSSAFAGGTAARLVASHPASVIARRASSLSSANSARSKQRTSASSCSRPSRGPCAVAFCGFSSPCWTRPRLVRCFAPASSACSCVWPFRSFGTWDSSHVCSRSTSSSPSAICFGSRHFPPFWFCFSAFPSAAASRWQSSSSPRPTWRETCACVCFARSQKPGTTRKKLNSPSCTACRRRPFGECRIAGGTFGPQRATRPKLIS